MLGYSILSLRLEEAAGNTFDEEFKTTTDISSRTYGSPITHSFLGDTSLLCFIASVWLYRWQNLDWRHYNERGFSVGSICLTSRKFIIIPLSSGPIAKLFQSQKLTKTKDSLHTRTHNNCNYRISFKGYPADHTGQNCIQLKVRIKGHKRNENSHPNRRNTSLKLEDDSAVVLRAIA